GQFLSYYMAALEVSYMTEEQVKVATDYLNSLSEEQLATKENWELVMRYVSDPLSIPLRKVMQNRDKFYAVAGKEVVDNKLDNSIVGATMVLAHWRPGMEQAFDEKRNEELTDYLLTVDYAGAPAALAQLYTAAYIRKGDFRGMLDKMKEVFSYNMFRSGAGRSYFLNNIEALMLCDDKALVEEGIKWIDEVCLNTSDYFAKADLMSSKARLQTKIGDTSGADKSKIEEEKYNKEGERRSGGKVIRSMRMN
ncbi:MAG: thioredoxin, partial [Odoribacter sp.]|nr:thioredoxin [Odoribacter sp.]